MSVQSRSSGADGQGGQQGGAGDAGVEGAVVGGGVQHAMKDAAHHIVPPAGQVAGQVEGFLPDDAHGAPPVVVGVGAEDAGDGGLENGFVVQGEDGAPGVGQGVDDVAGIAAAADAEALVGAHWRPLAGVGGVVGPAGVGIRAVGGGQMSVQPGVEHHGAGDDQGAAHGGGIVAGGLPAADGAVIFAGVAELVAARFRRGGQIQALRQAFLLVEGQQLNGLADFVGQAGGGQVGVAQLGRRQGYRGGQVGGSAFGPLGGAVVLVQNGVGQAGLGQGVLVGVIGVADGDGGVAVAVVNAVEAVGHGVFPLAVVLPRFGLNDDNMAAEADAAVGAPAALALEGALGAGAQALLAEDDAEGGVEVLLVGAWHNGAPGGGAGDAVGGAGAL